MRPPQSQLSDAISLLVLPVDCLSLTLCRRGGLLVLVEERGQQDGRGGEEDARVQLANALR